MNTVANLIAQLSEIEDKEQPIAFQYYLAEHFEFEDLGSPTTEQFAKAVERANYGEGYNEQAEALNDTLFDLMSEVAK
jgi:hypothetical protein